MTAAEKKIRKKEYMKRYYQERKAGTFVKTRKAINWRGDKSVRSEYGKSYYANNKSKWEGAGRTPEKKAYMAEWRKQNKGRISEYQKANQPTKSANDKRHRQANPERSRAYFRNRRQTDINYKLTVNLRRRMHKAVIQKLAFSPRTMDALGCTIEEFRAHIESLFKPGMSWKNYGYSGWHIDHKRPCSSFDLTQESEIRKCFHFSNMQPLWWKENLEKGDKF